MKTLIAALLIPGVCWGSSLTSDGEFETAWGKINLPDNAATVELWFKTTNRNGGLFTAATWYDSIRPQIQPFYDRHISLTNGNLKAYLWQTNNEAEAIVTVGYNYADGEWHHVAHVFGGSQGGQKLYVDGQLAASGTRTHSDFTWQEMVVVGGWIDSPGIAPIIGNIDEVRIWTVARSADEIATNLFQRLKGNELRLLAYWPFDEGSGSNTVDLASQGGRNTLKLANPAGAWSRAEPFGDITGTVAGPQGPAAGVRLELCPDAFDSVRKIPTYLPPIYTTNLSHLLFFPNEGPFFPNAPSNLFGAVFQGTLYCNRAYSYQFGLYSEDGAILMIDNILVVDRDRITEHGRSIGHINLEQGAHPIVVKYFNNRGRAGVHLNWSFYQPPSGDTSEKFLSTQRNNFLWLEPPGFKAKFYNAVQDTVTDTSGQFKFSLRQGNYRIQPVHSHYVFEPGERLVSSPAADVNFSVTASPPRISDISDQTIPEDAERVVHFDISDLQTPPDLLHLEVQTTNQSLYRVLSIGNSGTNAQLIIIPEFNRHFTNDLTVVVSDGALSTSNTFLLQVTSVHHAPVAGYSAALGFAGMAGGVQSKGNLPLAIDDPPHTIEAWVNLDAPLSHRTALLSLGSHAGSHGWWVEPDGHGLFGRWDGTQVVGVDPAIPLGTWTHLAATFDGSNYIAYVDGTPAAAMTLGGLDFSNSQLLLGTSADPNARAFKGAMQEVRVWNYARGADQILNDRKVPLEGTETGLVLYWRCNDGIGPYASDSASPPQPGVLSDAVQWIAGTPNLMTWLVDEDGSRQLYLPGLNFETPNLVYELKPPTHGTISGTGPWITYTPDKDYAGPDSFSYTVNDGVMKSSQPATVAIQVEPINAAPTLTPIADQLIEEDSTHQIRFTVTDRETPLDQLQFYLRSDNPELVPVRETNLWLSGSGSNRTLTVLPAKGEAGLTTISLNVKDTGVGDAVGPGKAPITTTVSFRLKVISAPVYAIVDLGGVGGFDTSRGWGLNDQGIAVGSVEGNHGTQLRAFVRESWFNEAAPARLLASTTGSQSQAFAINARNLITGTALYGGRYHLVRFQDNAMDDLGLPRGATEAVGYGLNAAGRMVGYAVINQKTNAFLYGGSFTNLGFLPGGAFTVAKAINDADTIVGYGKNAAGQLRAITWADGIATPLEPPAGFVASVGSAINNSGWVAGYYIDDLGQTAPFLYDTRNRQPLGTLAPLGSSVAQALNAFGQVAIETGTGTAQRAWLFSAGTLRDLNSLVAEGYSGWTLQTAKAINDQGMIVGTGQKEGQTRAYLAVPGRAIGRAAPRPPDAFARDPDKKLLKGQMGDSDVNMFYWSDPDKKLFPIRPGISRLGWYISPAVAETNHVEEVVVSVWPKTPITHIAGSPVNVQPANPEVRHAFVEMKFTTSFGANVDPGSKIFAPTNSGYSVLHYLASGGRQPDPTVHPSYFEVIRTVSWNDPLVLQDAVPWPVGLAVTNAGHQDYDHRNGYVLFTNAFYDATGTPPAYDRANRLGPILPVNQHLISSNAPHSSKDLVVVWYTKSPIHVPWASLPVRYSLAWPTNAPRMIIASGLGSGPLRAVDYPEMRVYHQPDPLQPGFNPNEEHALIRPASTLGEGSAVFALRNDLNPIYGASEPYVLLKYKDPLTHEWCLRVFQVLAEESPYFFHYQGEAGKEIQPPWPLATLNLCPESYGVSGPYWEDYLGRLYARAAGHDGSTAAMVLRWFYPMQPDFYLLDGAQQTVSPGTSVPWLDRRAGGQPGTPLDVHYTIRWPAQVPTLQIGETLLNPKRGLPGVKNMASVQIIYDDLNYTDANPTHSVARLFDPLSPRTLALPADFTFPESVRRLNQSGKEVFLDLPYDLRVRLAYDPVNRWLSFSGFLDESAAGEPLLLPNVMTARERERIQALDGTTAVSFFDQKVDQLYDLCRNPYRLDLDKDGAPDKALLIGLTNGPSGPVLETWGALPKALTAGLQVAPTLPAPGTALDFDGQDDFVALPNLPNLADFTLSAWIKPSATHAEDMTILGNGTTQGAGIILQILGTQNKLRLYERGNNSQAYLETLLLDSTVQLKDGQWHHVAAVRNAGTVTLLVDAQAVATADSGSAGQYQTTTGLTMGATAGEANFFKGWIDEVRIWRLPQTEDQIRQNYRQHLTGSEPGLVSYWTCDEGAGTTTIDLSTNAFSGTLKNGLPWIDNTGLLAGIPPRFLTLVENNDPSLSGSPISLQIIQISGGPFTGDLKVIYPDNVIDERLTLRTSGDFGCAPERLQFEWYYKPSAAGRTLPVVNPNTVEITDLNGWSFFGLEPPGGQGANYITLGDGKQAGILVLSDNWFICRYRGYAVDLKNAQVWSDWIGAPGGGPQLAEGWIKRVMRGLNPYDARTTNFHASAVSTYSSMLMQAGPRYEGDIALNPDAVNAAGLIEAYTTVLKHGRQLSIDATVPVDYPDANNALLLAANRIASLYALLGNEAYADAMDPTIGFGTESSEYGFLASSIFAFQNQLDSLLEEELTLLRGRNDQSSSVQANPVYNRLFWNFTLGDGQPAYVQTYNLTDQNHDGLIDSKDARILYPQGHGDAWGHYLTALTTFYDLLRHPTYTWVPRTEYVLVAGVPIAVDYTDERKFAHLAAQKAKTGAQIMELTYRWNYVDDPTGQWQGYQDTNPDRAWGVSEWARRTGQGAFIDWAVANAILPAHDPNPAHQGIQKIDRTTVSELDEIALNLETIQASLDKADAGLNPVGLASGVVPFDIDPTLIAANKTHFEQIYDRALQAMANALLAFNQANKMTENLRRNQDTTDKFSENILDQERDYRNRLIEIFGYPYAGDIGPGGTYPATYDGPDLYHYQYVATRDLAETVVNPTNTLVAFFKPMKTALNNFGFFFENDLKTFSLGPFSFTFGHTNDVPGLLASPAAADTILQVNYPRAASGYAFVAPKSWGQRRAPGELQRALSDWLQAQNRLEQGLKNYDNLLRDIQDQTGLIEARYNLRQQILEFKHNLTLAKVSIAATIASAKIGSAIANALSHNVLTIGDASQEALPKSVGLSMDATSAARSAIKLSFSVASSTAGKIAQGLDVVAQVAEKGIDVANGMYQESVETANYTYEQKQMLLALQQLVRQEGPLRLELASLAEAVNQSQGYYLTALAKGLRLVEERIAFRQRAAAEVSKARYQDMTFRVVRNDALEKYNAQFELAARYVFLAATAYDYETGLLGTVPQAGHQFLTEIVRQRSLGQIANGIPMAGSTGLADVLARLGHNFEVLKPQLGFNNPQTEANRFSLRKEWFRIRDDADELWQASLMAHRIPNLWDVPEFRRYCRPPAAESSGPQPGIVIRFPTVVLAGRNFFGWPLGGGDSAYDPSQFVTKIRAVGLWFSNYDGNGLSFTPRVYLVPVGEDVLRSPAASDFHTRLWKVADQKLPVPFPLSPADFARPSYIPINDSFGSEILADVRQFSMFRAYHDSGYANPTEMTTDSRLIGRSVWNTEWMLVIPGTTLLNDKDRGLDVFIHQVKDIKLLFQTYSYSGN